MVLRALLFAALLSSLSSAQKPPAAEPPEEDESLVAKEYAFNPLQASKEMKIGEFYFKKGNYRAAAARFEEATKWDPTAADGYYRLGEAREKMKDQRGAREAYAKYVELAPEGKNAATARRKLKSAAKQ